MQGQIVPQCVQSYRDNLSLSRGEVKNALTLGERIAQCRRAKNVTQKELAAYLGLTERGVRRYEADEREPGIARLIELSDYFNVSVDYLVGRTDDPTRH